MKSLALLAALLCVSCSSLKHSEFYVASIDTARREVRGVILLDDEVYRDADGAPVLTPARIEVEYRVDPTTGQYRTVKLGVRPVSVENGEITGGLDEGEPAPFLENYRFVPHNDPQKQLFILTPNLDY